MGMVAVFGVWDDVNDPIIIAKIDVMKMQYYFIFAALGLGLIGGATSACLQSQNMMKFFTFVQFGFFVAQVAMFWIKAADVFNMENTQEYPNENEFVTGMVEFLFYATIVTTSLLLFCCLGGVCKIGSMGPGSSPVQQL